METAEIYEADRFDYDPAEFSSNPEIETKWAKVIMFVSCLCVTIVMQLPHQFENGNFVPLVIFVGLPVMFELFVIFIMISFISAFSTLLIEVRYLTELWRFKAKDEKSLNMWIVDEPQRENLSIKDRSQRRNLRRCYFIISVISMASALTILTGALVSVGSRLWQTAQGKEVPRNWKNFNDFL